jgi:hypothetical protein
MAVRFPSVTTDEAFAGLREAFPSKAEFQTTYFRYAVRNGQVAIGDIPNWIGVDRAGGSIGRGHTELFLLDRGYTEFFLEIVNGPDPPRSSADQHVS